MSLVSEIGPDVANASTTKTFFVGFARPSTLSITFARVGARFDDFFLAVSDFETVQSSVFTVNELVTAAIAAVNDCHNTLISMGGLE